MRSDNMANFNLLTTITIIYGIIAFIVIFTNATPQRRFNLADDLTGQSSQNQGTQDSERFEGAPFVCARNFA